MRTGHCFSAVALALGVALVSVRALAADPPSAATNAPAGAATGTNAPAGTPTKSAETNAPVVTEGTVTIGGQSIPYRATAGMLPILGKDEKPTAQVFYIAYVATNHPDAGTRPITFCFNGGPGSSSVWLHLGAFGPRRVEMPGDGTRPPRPPGRLIPNEHSILDATDLVFIDPVSTGFSRPEQPDKAADFHGQDKDIQTVAEFIRLYTTREKRWRSPKFLAGESYGVFRSAGLANYLQDHFGLYANGLVLVSGVLDFDTLDEGGLNDTPHLCFLSAMTATAHYHRRLPAELQADFRKAIAEARAFADGDYARALRLGAALPNEERKGIAAKLARLTGLPAGYIEDHNLRVSPSEFRKQLLKEQGLIIGRFDARVSMRDGNAAATEPEFDPSDVSVMGVFSASMNSYLREDLRFEKDLPYEILANVQPWPWSRQYGFPSTSRDLAASLKQNPHLQVLVQCAWRDLACPPDGIGHSLRQLQLPIEVRKNIRIEEYEAGHMLYLNPPDLKKSSADIRDFMRKALAN
jgi:carboxypeptidase C (cathepsin A)